MILKPKINPVLKWFELEPDIACLKLFVFSCICLSLLECVHSGILL